MNLVVPPPRGPAEWAARVRQLFSIKYGALAVLVLQNTFLVVLMRSDRLLYY
jgi:hypothetical protein